MKVLALRQNVVCAYADTQTYFHDYSKDNNENAFLISNLTAYTIFYLNYTDETLKILNESGIAAIELNTDHEFDTLVKSNFTYDHKSNIVFLHDFSYYSNNELRTNQFWLTKTDIESFMLPGWRLVYVGPNGILSRGHYKYSFTCQNTATDDDIIMEYIYSKELNFQSFMLEKLKKRVTTSISADRMINRLLKQYILLKEVRTQTIYNIGPRNESAFLFLDYPEIRHFSNGSLLVKDTLTLHQEKWLGMTLSQFDIGQFKNMMNVLTLIYRYYEYYKSKPLIYMLGSAPSWWIKDVKEYTTLKFETWDPLPTPFSDTHHSELFLLPDTLRLMADSVLYIDIRTDRATMSWIEWRKKVESETINNLEIAYAYLKQKGNRLCCVKMTAMDIELPINATLLHFPTTQIRSEFYLLLSKSDVTDVKRFVPKGVLYAFINKTLSDNVFTQKPFKLKPAKNVFILALYALSNDFNSRSKVIDLINSQERGLLTVRMNNSFSDECKTTFKVGSRIITDWTFLPTDFHATDAIITSLFGCMARYNLSSTLQPKPSGNNHLFILKGDAKFMDLDIVANHMTISRRSHQLRFSEAATTLSGYIFRDLANGKYNLIETHNENSVSGHVYNALIYFRYNYTFDLKRWIFLHSIGKVDIRGGRYYEHAPIELIYACVAAKNFASLQNDITSERFAEEIQKYITSVYSITYADDPNYYIGIRFKSIPYKYTVKDPHLTLGVLYISSSMEHEVMSILQKFKDDIFNLSITTSYTYQLTEGITVANINGVMSLYFQIYNAFYRAGITFGQSRMYIPHITLAYDAAPTSRIEQSKLHVIEIYLQKIKGECVGSLRR
uniref:Protein VP3 n=1 Tax=Rotavirus A TaxID=28875 RepID=A0A8D6C2A4_9REOV|nr:protein VP3 [Rotavirus A]